MTDEIIRKQKRQNYVRKDGATNHGKHNLSSYNPNPNEGNVEDSPGPGTYFSNYDGDANNRKSSDVRSKSVRSSRGEGLEGMMKGQVLRQEVVTPPVSVPCEKSKEEKRELEK
jgi:hypothetical protein